jgi:hypothetical protein
VFSLVAMGRREESEEESRESAMDRQQARSWFLPLIFYMKSWSY